MEEIIMNLTNGVLDNLNYGWIILFMTIESSFIPFPSEVVMIPAAYIASTPDAPMSFPMVVLAGTVGAMLGAIINYVLAYTLGRPVVYAFANSRFGHMCLINEEKVMQAEAYFDKHGAISTLVGRMIPTIRQLISIPAGLVRMKFSSFLFYTCLGAGLWNAILVAIGYAFHTVMPKEELMAHISHYSRIFGIAAILIIVAAVAYLIYKGRKK